MIHISLDLETLSTSCNATILSLGAVRFDIDKGDILEEFYYLVSMKSSMKLKFNIDPETIKWWMKQSDEARQIFSEKGIGINKVLTIFSEFLRAFSAYLSNFSPPSSAHLANSPNTRLSSFPAALV